MKSSGKPTKAKATPATSSTASSVKPAKRHTFPLVGIPGPKPEKQGPAAKQIQAQRAEIKNLHDQLQALIEERKHSEDQLRRLSAHLMRVQDEERRRIARELHDSTGQKLAAMGMLLNELSSSVQDSAKGREVLQGLADLLEGAHREIRTIAQLLHPPELDFLGLVSAIRTMAERFSERSRIAVEVEAPSEIKSLGDGDFTLFRVVQECLTNVHRHSGAQRAKIRLMETPEAVFLEVSDDGRGMAGKLVPEREQDSGEGGFGVGILGMKQRLSQLGGTLEISSKGKGTVVLAVLPKAQTKVVSA